VQSYHCELQSDPPKMLNNCSAVRTIHSSALSSTRSRKVSKLESADGRPPTGSDGVCIEQTRTPVPAGRVGDGRSYPPDIPIRMDK
jgi:hypothetical protein